MNGLFLSDEQQDALQELLNIAMGQAADSLARLIHSHVQLSIPEVVQSNNEQFLTRFAEANIHYLAQQSFLGQLNGEMLSLMFDGGTDPMAELMHYDRPLRDQDKQEMLLELSNILAGACLNGLIYQLHLKIQLAPPVLLTMGSLNSDQLRWQHALWMEVLFQIPECDFQARILICIEQHSIGLLKQHLDRLLN